MKFCVNKSMLVAVAIALVSSSLAMANHRGYRSNGWNSSQNGSSSCSCGSTVEKSAPAPAVASETPAPDKTADKTADKAASTRSFSYEPEKASSPATTNSAQAVRGNYSRSSGGNSRSSGGNSYDKAMRSKGY